MLHAQAGAHLLALDGDAVRCERVRPLARFHALRAVTSRNVTREAMSRSVT
jgi:hypothetical protein